MSKVDESSWITISITLTPDDIMEIEDAVADLRWHSGTSSGVLDHIVEQYKLKVEDSKPNTFAQEDFEFLKEMVSLGRASEGQRILNTSSYFMKKIIDLHAKYGKQRINKTIDLLKKHEAMHKATQTVMEKENEHSKANQE
ncbi:hypothetical protein UFOVP285_72 [uncultured Caudovirales phage]|uniref:Uncharacterized protein n=1 Tax=uncultured Caudovirales phage TaxID=2100421 RepID=A0A6J5LQS8_9CAUD|nr:hypothetical protein UFOVP285_72 [uncultured Caudovirales phage]